MTTPALYHEFMIYPSIMARIALLTKSKSLRKSWRQGSSQNVRDDLSAHEIVKLPDIMVRYLAAHEGNKFQA